MRDFTFATGAMGYGDAEAVYMLGRSILEFGGGLSGAGLCAYIPEMYFEDWQQAAGEMKGAGVALKMYRAGEKDLAFDYAFKVRAALAAEQDIQKGTVAWLDRHALVTGCCADLLLAPWEQFAYRPVNIRNIGCLYGEVPDAFWRDALRIAGVGPEKLFPVCSSVDRQVLNPYFFACTYVFRAESGLAAAWNALFDAFLRDYGMERHLADEEHRIFLHQAAFSLAAVKTVPREAVRELPYYYGYPVHLNGEIPEAYKAESMDGLNVAFFHRELHEYRASAGTLGMSDRLEGWFEDRIGEARERLYKS